MIVVRRAGDRFTTSGDGVTSRHSFSFGVHYDPDDVGHSVLVAHNDDVLAPGAGYGPHPHSDTEIVTWVLEGSLRQEDGTGVSSVLHPGWVRRTSAGRGIRHAERNDAPGAEAPTRFVQMWLRPDETGGEPSTAVAEADPGGGDGREIVPLVSGIAGLDAPVSLPVAGAALHLLRPSSRTTVVVPDAPRLHLFVTRGTVEVEGVGRLEDGDAVRLTGEAGPWVTAAGPAEALLWQLP